MVITPATSSRHLGRPRGLFRLIRASIYSIIIFSRYMSVLIAPGTIQLTVICRGPKSYAGERVIP